MRLLTDFNYRENPNRVWADLDEAEHYLDSELRIGVKAELFDGLGNECMGTVVDLDSEGGMVELELDGKTWRSTRRPNREFDYTEGQDARFANQTVRVETVA